MSLKTVLERHAPTLLELGRVVSNRRFELVPPRVTYAAGELHGSLKELFGFRGGTFFEVGANNGLLQSNTAYLERYMGWSGILVEAVPSLFVECVRNRPRAHCVHAALVPPDFSEPYIEVVYGNQVSLTSLSDLDPEKHVKGILPHLLSDRSLAGRKFLAPARTAASVITEAGIESIDLFSLDVEGAELAVLQGIDYEAVAPKYFLVELWTAPPVVEFLAQHGYSLVEKLTKRDYLFERAA